MINQFIKVTGKNIILEFNEEEIYIKNGRLYEIALKAFFKLDRVGGVAKFDVKSRTLIFEVNKYVKSNYICIILIN